MNLEALFFLFMTSAHTTRYNSDQILLANTGSGSGSPNVVRCNCMCAFRRKQKKDKLDLFHLLP